MECNQSPNTGYNETAKTKQEWGSGATGAEEKLRSKLNHSAKQKEIERDHMCARC
jgi:hypothetical protein